MSVKNVSDREILRKLLKESGIDSYAEFSRKIKISERQFYRIENGLIFNLTLDTLRKIAEGLNLSLTGFLAKFTDEFSIEGQNKSEGKEKLIAEYEKMQLENQEIASELNQEWQQKTIATLEPLLLQLPTITEAVKKNPQLPASRLLPLLKPFEELLSAWKIEKVGRVGEIVNYNPQEHELMEAGDVDISESSLVKVRYVGYRQENKLLYRARVSPVN